MITPSRILRAAFLAALALPLAACWESEEPLILPAISVAPLENGTYYIHQDGDVSNVTLIKFPGGGYIYLDEEEHAAMPMLVHRFADDWYILQFSGVSDGQQLFGIARTMGDRVVVYDPECEDEMGTIKDVEASGDCDFSSLDGLIAAAQIFRRNLETGAEYQPDFWFEPAERKVISN